MSHLRAIECPGVQTKPLSCYLKQAPPSLWRLGSRLLGATVMGEEGWLPWIHQSSVIWSPLPEGQSKVCCSSQPSYEGAGDGQQQTTNILRRQPHFTGWKTKAQIWVWEKKGRKKRNQISDLLRMKFLPQKWPGVRHMCPCCSGGWGRHHLIN